MLKEYKIEQVLCCVLINFIVMRNRKRSLQILFFWQGVLVMKLEGSHCGNHQVAGLNSAYHKNNMIRFAIMMVLLSIFLSAHLFWIYILIVHFFFQIICIFSIVMNILLFALTFSHLKFLTCYIGMAATRSWVTYHLLVILIKPNKISA